MKRSPPAEPHLDFATTLDYLEQRLDAAGRKRIEDHLGRPCSGCRERLLEMSTLIDTLRQDRSLPVPAWLHARALEVFEPREQVSPARRLLESLAELVFDSLATPMPATSRRSVGEARRLGFKLGGHSLDLEVEREGATTLTLRGSLQALDPALWTLEVHARGERRVARPDANGQFALEEVPAGVLELQVYGPAGRFRLPSIEP